MTASVVEVGLCHDLRVREKVLGRLLPRCCYPAGGCVGTLWAPIISGARSNPWGPHEPSEGLGFICLGRNYRSRGYMTPTLGFIWSPRMDHLVESRRL